MTTRADNFVAHSLLVTICGRRGLLQRGQNDNARVYSDPNRANNAYQSHDAEWVAEECQREKAEAESAGNHAEGECRQSPRVKRQHDGCQQ
ncbi:MAG: Uncharacterised protein [Halieaceae bacterium]|nr:MAG: Uncharacterised protein [Halieaceae bacterium]